MKATNVYNCFKFYYLFLVIINHGLKLLLVPKLIIWVVLRFLFVDILRNCCRLNRLMSGNTIYVFYTLYIILYSLNIVIELLISIKYRNIYTHKKTHTIERFSIVSVPKLPSASISKRNK